MHVAFLFINQFGDTMAIDAYLQIDGIKGESVDSAHLDSIEMPLVHLGVVQPRSATMSTGDGHTSAHSVHCTLTICL